jgi:hypothetical protein
MNADESLRQFGLVPSDDALPRIRALLAGEADAERHGRPRQEDLALLCCVQLFSRGLPEDVLRIWDAKQSGFHLEATWISSFCVGGGHEATRLYLASQTGDAAASALKKLDECEQAGQFADFSPQVHLEHYRNYFGVT